MQMSQENFSIVELLNELKDDDSWESDPEVRKNVVMALETLLMIRF